MVHLNKEKALVGLPVGVQWNYIDTFAEQWYLTTLPADGDSALLIPSVHVWYDG